MEKPNYKRPRRPYGSDIPANKLQFYIPDPKVAAKCFRANADPRSKFLPPVVDGIRVRVGVAQGIRPGSDNIGGYPDIHRADYVRTPVEKFARAQSLNTLHQPDTLAEIRLHHVFEHISILDIDTTLGAWDMRLRPAARNGGRM